jgi:recombination protein RecA
MYGEGISKEGCIIDLGVEEGIVKKSGAWYTYDDERLGQGREAAKDLLRETPDLRDEIEGKLREAMGLTQSAKPQAETPPQAKEDTVATESASVA